MALVEFVMILLSFDVRCDKLAPLDKHFSPTAVTSDTLQSQCCSFFSQEMRASRLDSPPRSKPSPDRCHDPSELAYAELTAQSMPPVPPREYGFTRSNKRRKQHAKVFVNVRIGPPRLQEMVSLGLRCNHRRCARSPSSLNRDRDNQQNDGLPTSAGFVHP